MDNIKIAGFIADKRKEKQLTQQQLADQLHVTHKAVSKFCAEQNEVFTITTKALAKQLAEEGLIEVTDSGKNTRSLPLGGVNKRVMLLKKNAVKDILDGI